MCKCGMFWHGSGHFCEYEGDDEIEKKEEAEEKIVKMEEISENYKNASDLEEETSVKAEHEIEKLYSCKLCTIQSFDEVEIMQHAERQHKEEYEDCLDSYDEKEENFSQDDDDKERIKQKMRKRKEFMKEQFMKADGKEKNLERTHEGVKV